MARTRRAAAPARGAAASRLAAPPPPPVPRRPSQWSDCPTATETSRSARPPQREASGRSTASTTPEKSSPACDPSAAAYPDSPPLALIKGIAHARTPAATAASASRRSRMVTPRPGTTSAVASSGSVEQKRLRSDADRKPSDECAPHQCRRRRPTAENRDDECLSGDCRTQARHVAQRTQRREPEERRGHRDQHRPQRKRARTTPRVARGSRRGAVSASERAVQDEQKPDQRRA